MSLITGSAGHRRPFSAVAYCRYGYRSNCNHVLRAQPAPHEAPSSVSAQQTDAPAIPIHVHTRAIYTPRVTETPLGLLPPFLKCTEAITILTLRTLFD